MSLPRVVLVTGANSGIGYETVKAFLESARSYHILLGSRNLDKGKEAVAILQKEVPSTNNTVEAIQVDLTSDDSIEKAYGKVKASPGRLDYLVNNAGTLHIPLLRDM
jgi:NAD(P)-dependent dehydrogenase (short-subunit alcohol dehydrogenase family)